VAKIKTRISCSVILLSKFLLLDNVEKYCTAGQATDDNMAHAHCMLDNQGYKNTHKTCNTFCFFHCKNSCTNVPECHVIHTLSVCLSVLSCNIIQPNKFGEVHKVTHCHDFTQIRVYAVSLNI